MTPLTEAMLRNDLVKTGLAQVGADYRDSAVAPHWPPAQFDCSTFVHWLYAKHGLNIDNGLSETKLWPEPMPHVWHKYEGYTQTQQNNFIRRYPTAIISFGAIKPGDLLYYDKPGEHHVVMYIGDGKVVHAAGTKYGVIVSHVVRPGVVGHGGKTLTMCVSAVKLAKLMGVPFAKPTAPKPKPVKPPVKRNTVFLSHILSAIKKDGPAAQGHTTYKMEVLLVEWGLVREVLLNKELADGSAGTSSFGNGSAYQKWQQRLGYHGSDADGIPGHNSLTELGRKHGFNVI